MRLRESFEQALALNAHFVHKVDAHIFRVRRQPRANLRLKRLGHVALQHLVYHGLVGGILGVEKLALFSTKLKAILEEHDLGLPRTGCAFKVRRDECPPPEGDLRRQALSDAIQTHPLLARRSFQTFLARADTSRPFYFSAPPSSCDEEQCAKNIQHQFRHQNTQAQRRT